MISCKSHDPLPSTKWNLEIQPRHLHPTPRAASVIMLDLDSPTPDPAFPCQTPQPTHLHMQISLPFISLPFPSACHVKPKAFRLHLFHACKTPLRTQLSNHILCNRKISMHVTLMWGLFGTLFLTRVGAADARIWGERDLGSLETIQLVVKSSRVVVRNETEACESVGAFIFMGERGLPREHETTYLLYCTSTLMDDSSSFITFYSLLLTTPAVNR